MRNWRTNLWLKAAVALSLVAVIVALLIVARDYLMWLIWLALVALAVSALAALLMALDRIHESWTHIHERHIATTRKQIERDKERVELDYHRGRKYYERAIKERARQRQAALPVRQSQYVPPRQAVPALPAPGQTYRPVRESEPYIRVVEEGYTLPNYVSYDEVKNYIKRGQFCLGINERGQFAHCSFDELMTMWIVGGSDTGKSNTVALKVHESIQNGRNMRIILIDPHKRKPDSLYNRLRCYEHLFLQVAQSEEEIYEALCRFKAEYQNRLDTDDLEKLDDLLLIVDETKRVYSSDDERIGKMLKRIAEICGYESRGFGMFGWFISQQAAGLKWLRDAVMTVVCHKMHTMEERTLALNGNQKIAREMDEWSGKGRVAIYGQKFSGFFILQMPDFQLPKSSPTVARLATDRHTSAPLHVPDPLPKPKTSQDEVIIELGKRVYREGYTSYSTFAAGMTADGIKMSKEQARTWLPRVRIALEKEEAAQGV